MVKRRLTAKQRRYFAPRAARRAGVRHRSVMRGLTTLTPVAAGAIYAVANPTLNNLAAKIGSPLGPFTDEALLYVGGELGKRYAPGKDLKAVSRDLQTVAKVLAGMQLVQYLNIQPFGGTQGYNFG